MTHTESRISFKVALREDMHTGTGVGRLGIVDDTQSVDQRGRPIVWGSTLRGLLREAGEDWLSAREMVSCQNGVDCAARGRDADADVADKSAQARQTGATPDAIRSDREILYELFGSPVNEQTRQISGRTRGHCIVRALRMNSPSDVPLCLNWTGTARAAHSRQPQEQTLRTIEYAAAGLLLDGELRLLQDDGDPRAADRGRVLRKCLDRLTVIGGGKTRGWGQVRVQIETNHPCAIPPPDKQAVAALIQSIPKADPAIPVCLHLLVRNLEPLNLMTTALAGNLNFSQSYLSGSTLRGAILHWVSHRDAFLPADLADPERFALSNGYVVPKDVAADLTKNESRNAAGDCPALARVQVLPIPLSLREPKAGAVEPASSPAAVTSGERKDPSSQTARASANESPFATAGKSDFPVPWWARPQAADDRLGCAAELDAVAFARQPETLGSRKRVKFEDYLVRRQGDPQWRRVRPGMGVLLRNRVPTSRLDPERRGGKQQAGYQDEAFFSEQVLWENQCFLLQLWFRDRADAERFCRTAAPLLLGPENDRSWLQVGRGGRPARVEAWHWTCPATAGSAANFPGESQVATSAPRPGTLVVPPVGAQGPAEAGATSIGPSSRTTLTVTLTSDLIARTPWLTFCTHLTAVDIVRLVAEAAARRGLPAMGIPAKTAEIHRLLQVDMDRCVTESVEVYGFNSATGLPRAAALALKRGSVFTVTAPESPETTAALQQLRDTLQTLNNGAVGIGERTGEGFGRVAVDLDIHQPAYWTDFDRQKSPAGRNQGLRRDEVVLERVLRFFDELTKKDKEASDTRGKEMPSISQWQWLRHRAEACGHVDQIEGLLREVRQHAQRLAGVPWQPLIQGIDKEIEAFSEFDERQLFLTALAQLAVAEARRHRGKERRS